MSDEGQDPEVEPSPDPDKVAEARIRQSVVEQEVDHLIDKVLSLDAWQDAESYYEEKDQLRQELVRRLFATMRLLNDVGDVQRVATEEYFENVLFGARMDQLRRAYGFTAADERAGHEVQRMNEKLGINAAGFDPNEEEHLIRVIDQLTFVRQVSFGVGLPPHTIDRMCEMIMERFLGKD